MTGLRTAFILATMVVNLTAADPQIYPEATPPTTWSVPDGTNVAWTAKTGLGMSCPVTIGDLVVVLVEPETVIAYRQADGSEAWRVEHSVFDLIADADAAKGREALGKCVAFWQQRVRRKHDDRKAEAEPFWNHVEQAGVPLLRAEGYESYGWTHGEPASDGERVYVQFGTGLTMALEPDGSVLWQRRCLQGAAMACASAAPLLVDGKLVFKDWAHKNERAPGRNIVLVALDATSGDQQWRSACMPESDHGAWGGMAVATVDGKPIIITPGGCAVNPADGTIMVEDLGNSRYGSRVAAGPGVAVFGEFIVPLIAEGDKLQKPEGTRLDRDARDNAFVYGDRILAPVGKKDHGIFDLAGAQLWKGRLKLAKKKVPRFFTAYSCVAGDLFIQGADPKHVAVVRLQGDQPKVIAHNPTGCLSAIPVADGSRLYLRLRDTLVAVGKQ